MRTYNCMRIISNYINIMSQYNLNTSCDKWTQLIWENLNILHLTRSLRRLHFARYAQHVTSNWLRACSLESEIYASKFIFVSRLALRKQGYFYFKIRIFLSLYDRTIVILHLKESSMCVRLVTFEMYQS